MRTFKKFIGRLVLKMLGWKLETGAPELDKYVFIAYPHTSNWDLVLMLAMAFELELKISWMGKRSIFKPPFGWFMKRLGGVSIDRRAAHGVVEQITAIFEAREKMMLAVPAEGTRGYVDYWKSGFYHIARGANVPVVTGYLDYGRKIGGLGPPITLTGDVKADMDRMRAFYAGKQGKFPAKVGKIRLRSEDEAS